MNWDERLSATEVDANLGESAFLPSRNAAWTLPVLDAGCCGGVSRRRPGGQRALNPSCPTAFAASLPFKGPEGWPAGEVAGSAVTAVLH